MSAQLDARRLRALLPRALFAALPLLVAACGDSSFGGAPENDGPPGPPTEPPPTGSKWQGKETLDACGRTGIDYVLVDEVCGGIDDPDYMAAFHAPIIRDGALIGSDLFAVDATYLWVLDVSQPEAPVRRALLSGFGQPLAVGAHSGRLVIAAGDEGLLLVDVADPSAPQRLATIELDGPALDVFIDGDRAFVAMGAAGIGVVDLTSVEAPRTLAVPAFVAAVASSDGRVFAAACDRLSILDETSGTVLGEVSVDGVMRDDVLVAPFKDVAIVGDIAFVAAGKFGAISVDVSDPVAPVVLGNCAVDDPSFYASGVRVDGERLFVAGGDYGILPLPVAVPHETCAGLFPPSEPPSNEEPTCSTEPPWDVVPWVDSWSPPPVPPEGRDPIQTLPAGELVFAFGDATRIGLRAIDVRLAADPALTKIGRYAEPRLTEGIAAYGDRVLVTGKAGGLFQNVGDTLIPVGDLALARTARAAAFLDDGRWILGTTLEDESGQIDVEGGVAPFAVAATIWPGALPSRGSTVLVPTASGADAIDVDGVTTAIVSDRTARLPAALAFHDDRVVIAAPEWVDAISIDDLGAAPLAPSAFDASELDDVSQWRRALPRRQLLETPAGLAEVSSLGGRAALVLHGVSESVVTLPPGDYVAGASAGGRVFLVSVDRGIYRTTLVTVSVAGESPAIVGTASLTGAASGLAASGSRLYLADGDRGVRIFDLSATAPELVASVDLVVGGAP